VIKNLSAFENLVLDWIMWSRAPKKIRKLLFASIADMLDSNNLASFFNVRH